MPAIDLKQFFKDTLHEDMVDVGAKVNLKDVNERFDLQIGRMAVEQAVKVTLQKLHWILLGMLVFNIVAIFIFARSRFDPLYILIATVVTYPVAVLGFFIFWVFKSRSRGLDFGAPKEEI